MKKWIYAFAMILMTTTAMAQDVFEEELSDAEIMVEETLDEMIEAPVAVSEAQSPVIEMHPFQPSPEVPVFQPVQQPAETVYIKRSEETASAGENYKDDMLATDPIIIDAMQRRENEVTDDMRAVLIKRMNKHLATSDVQFKGVALINQYGDVIVKNPETFKIESNDAITENTVGSVHTNPVTGEKEITSYVPVYNAKDRFIGVIAAQ